MKIHLYIILYILSSSLLSAQIGINTDQPMVNLHIKNNAANSPTPEGIIIPKIEGNTLKQMDLLYNDEQD